MEEALHPLEKKLLDVLKDENDLISIEDLERKTGLEQVMVMRALQWLSSKAFVEVFEDIKEVVKLGPEGVKYINQGMPEQRFLEALINEELGFDDLKNKAGLSNDEFNVAMGILRKKGCISILEGKISITSIGRDFLKKETPEQTLLKKISNEDEVNINELSNELMQAFKTLKSRKKILNTEIRIKRKAKITNSGLKASKKLSFEEEIGQLTQSIIKLKSWKDKNFRPYDVKAPVPRTFPGKKHFLYQIAERIKQVFTSMGFQEMRSNYAETNFWNYDVMFFPQDHPDRSIMDTFYCKTPSKGIIPQDYAKIIKQVQENGWKTGSKGRMTEWDVEEAKKLILRCHTTQTSFRILSKKLKPPYKFFSVDRVFRNETLDQTHLAEFHQVEGFVVGEGLTLRHLMGNLKEFYKSMGVTKLKFKPVYNPYTEPSMEYFAWFPNLKKWVELGNSGIFRPEVLEPVGVKTPVIAWGLALERLAMFLYDVNDIRQVLGETVRFDNIRKARLLTDIKK